jgi:hypothetical protein
MAKACRPVKKLLQQGLYLIGDFGNMIDTVGCHKGGLCYHPIGSENIAH